MDIQTLFQFTTCAFILSPLTFLWLEGLESSFPGEKTEPDLKDKGNEKKETKTKLNIPNTLAKIAIDQIIGGALSTALYIVTLGTLRGQNYDVITTQLQNVSRPPPPSTGIPPMTRSVLCHPNKELIRMQRTSTRS